MTRNVPRDQQFALNADTERVWLHIRDKGGWWSAADICYHWRPTFELVWLRHTLRQLEMHGFVAKRLDIDKGMHVYGVTAACEPLPGHKLEPRPC